MNIKKTIKRIALFFLCLLGGCEQQMTAKTTEKRVQINSAAGWIAGGLQTVDFDGHKWVIFDCFGKGGNAIHHPDCTCKGDKK